MAEEFGLPPSMARAELYENNPWPDVLDIMEMRAFARAKEVIDRAQKQDDIPLDNPMVRFVMEIQALQFKREGRLGKPLKKPKARDKQQQAGAFGSPGTEETDG